MLCNRLKLQCVLLVIFIKTCGQFYCVCAEKDFFDSEKMAPSEVKMVVCFCCIFWLFFFSRTRIAVQTCFGTLEALLRKTGFAWFLILYRLLTCTDTTILTDWPSLIEESQGPASLEVIQPEL